MANEVQLIIGAATDVGRERQVNEDSHGFVHCAAGDLLIVCDGMGGHAQGDLASRTARDAIAAYAATYAASLPPRDLLERATLHAHEAVRAVAAQSQANAGMGTTCVLALVQRDQLWVSNVGDSRCYLVRGSNVSQLSVDHTKARKLLDAGIITKEQFVNHPEKGVLAQALGQRAAPQPFVSEAIPLNWNDYVVLCSDGVYDSTERDLADLTGANNPNYGAHNLVIEAVKRDGKDNATVVIGRYADMNATAPAALPQRPEAVAVAPPTAPWKQPVMLAAMAGVLAVGAVAGWALGAHGGGHASAEHKPPEGKDNEGKPAEVKPPVAPPGDGPTPVQPAAPNDPVIAPPSPARPQPQKPSGGGPASPNGRQGAAAGQGQNSPSPKQPGRNPGGTASQDGPSPPKSATPTGN